eukprot:TRINITY_DN16559_c0_g2_i1.p1 TRINITY_DN16559_c0_g2~~TRINITY_DN16559_c0_g2_i1.p1  ORF type:complete len:1647 (+),score=470.14 TRINITY_DN16559_c0_g2_i1:77-4942(+)
MQLPAFRPPLELLKDPLPAPRLTLRAASVPPPVKSPHRTRLKCAEPQTAGPAGRYAPAAQCGPAAGRDPVRKQLDWLRGGEPLLQEERLCVETAYAAAKQRNPRSPGRRSPPPPERPQLSQRPRTGCPSSRPPRPVRSLPVVNHSVRVRSEEEGRPQRVSPKRSEEVSQLRWDSEYGGLADSLEAEFPATEGFDALVASIDRVLPRIEESSLSKKWRALGEWVDKYTNDRDAQRVAACCARLLKMDVAGAAALEDEGERRPSSGRRRRISDLKGAGLAVAMTARVRIQGRRRDIAAACVALDQLLVYVGRCHPCLWPVARKTRHVLLSLFFGMKDGSTVSMTGDAETWAEDPAGLVPVPKLAAGDGAQLRRALAAYGERKSWYELAQNMQKKLGIMRGTIAEAEEQSQKLMQVMDRAIRFWQGVVRGVILRAWRASLRMRKEMANYIAQEAHESVLRRARERWAAEAEAVRKEQDEKAALTWRLRERELQKAADGVDAKLQQKAAESERLREQLAEHKEQLAALSETVAQQQDTILSHEKELQRFQALCREFIKVSLEGPTWAVIRQEEMREFTEEAAANLDLDKQSAISPDAAAAAAAAVPPAAVKLASAQAAAPPAAKPVAKRARGQSVAQAKPAGGGRSRAQSVASRKRSTTIRGGGPPDHLVSAAAAATAPGTTSPDNSPSAAAGRHSSLPAPDTRVESPGAGAADSPNTASSPAAGSPVDARSPDASPTADACTREATVAEAAPASPPEPGAAPSPPLAAPDALRPKAAAPARSRRKLNWTAAEGGGAESTPPPAALTAPAFDAALMTSEECAPDPELENSASLLPQRQQRGRRKLNWTPDSSPQVGSGSRGSGSAGAGLPAPADGGDAGAAVPPAEPLPALAAADARAPLLTPQEPAPPQQGGGGGGTPPPAAALPASRRRGRPGFEPQAEAEEAFASEGSPVFGARVDTGDGDPLQEPAAQSPAAPQGQDEGPPPPRRRTTLAQRKKSAALSVATEDEPAADVGLEETEQADSPVGGGILFSPRHRRGRTAPSPTAATADPAAPALPSIAAVPPSPLPQADSSGRLVAAGADQALPPRRMSSVLRPRTSVALRRASSFSAQVIDGLSKEELMAQAQDEDCILRWFNKAIELSAIPHANRFKVPSFMVGHRLLAPYILVMHYMSPGDISVTQVMKVLNAETDMRKAELVLEAAQKLDMAFPLTARELINPQAREQHVLIGSALFQRFSDPHLSAACGMGPLRPPPGTGPHSSPLWIGEEPKSAKEWHTRMNNAWKRSMRWRGAGAAAQSLATEALLSRVQGRAVKAMSAAETAQLRLYTRNAIALSEDLLPEDPVARQRAVDVLNKVLTEHYRNLRKIYLYYSTGDHHDVELSQEETVKMMQEAKVLGAKSNTGLTRPTFDSLFHRVTVHRGEPTLDATQFVSLCIRLAAEMKRGWMSHGKQVGLARRLQGLIRDLLIPNCHYTDLGEFQAALYGDACRDVLDRYQEWLLGTFRAFATVTRGDARLMSIKDFTSVVQEMNIIDSSCSHEMVRTVFVKMQDIENDVTVGIIRGEHSLQYREYVECMAGLALIKTPAPYLPFCRKVHRFFEQWLVPTFSEGKHWRVRSEIARIKQEY